MNRQNEDDDIDEGDHSAERSSLVEKERYEWESELDEYDEPDIYPSEKDYKWFDEVVTDVSDEEDGEDKAKKKDEEIKEESAVTTEISSEKEVKTEEECKKEGEEAKVEGEEAVQDDGTQSQGKAEEGGAEGEGHTEDGEDDDHFVPFQAEDEDEDGAQEETVKRYKTIQVRRLVERPPKIHYEPYEERIEFAEGTDLPDRPFHFLHSFGYDCQRLANLHVLDKDTLVFMSGFVLTFYNHKTYEKTYLRSLGGSSFGSLAVHPSKRLFAAAEKGHKPLIGIWSWDKLQLFRKLVDGTESVYASVNFSPDGKLLASQGGAPDFLITVWNWLKETPVLRVKSHAQDVYRVTFSKELSGLLTTSGLCHIKFWKMAHTFTGLKLKGDLGRFGKTELTDIEGYVEMPDGKVVSGTEWGNLLVWENGLVIAEICISNDTPCHKGNVRYITIVDGEFYSMGQDGMIKVWSFEAVDTAEIHTTEDSQKVAIKTLSKVCVHEEADIWFIVQDTFYQDPNHIFWFAQDGNGIIWKTDLSFLNTAKDPEVVFLAHGGPVVACETSPRLMLMASLGGDGRVNVYNYITKKIVASRRFNSPGSVMMWPSKGTDSEMCTLICGFADGVLRILLISQRRESSVMKGIVPLPFTIILIRVLKPHKAPITSIAVDSFGEIMMTGSEDGAVFFFDTQDNFNPLFFISLPVNVPVRKLMWINSMTNDRAILALCEDSVIQHIQVPNLFDHDSTMTYKSTHWKLLGCGRVKSIKSELRHSEELERIRLEEEEWQANYERELQRLVDDNIESQSQQNIRLLIEAEEREKEELSKPKPKQVKWVPYYPPKPSPILEVVEDPIDSNVLHLTMGEYDAGYVYSIKLDDLSVTYLETSGNDSPEDKNDEGDSERQLDVKMFEPFNATPIKDCDDVPVTKVVFTADGTKAMVGFGNGNVRMVKLDAPFTLKSMGEQWTEGIHDLVRGAITSLVFNHDETLLFTSGGDGNCFMFSTIDEPATAKYFSDAAKEKMEIPSVEDRGLIDIIDKNEYTLEDSKNIAKEMAILAAAKRNKAAKREEIARLRSWFADIVKRNNELPEEVRLTRVELTMVNDGAIRKHETIRESMVELNKQMAWESTKSQLALNKIKTFYKDPLEQELFFLKAFNSEMKIASFRLPRLPDFYYDAVDKYEKYSLLAHSHSETALEDMSELDIALFQPERKPKRKRGMDKFVYQKMVRIWERKQKKLARQWEWNQFLLTDPAGKDLVEEDRKIDLARETIGDLKLKTEPLYKPPDHLKLTVNRARKRLIDVEATMHTVKESFNEEMLRLRKHKISSIKRMEELRARLVVAQSNLSQDMCKPIPVIPFITEEENPLRMSTYTPDDVLTFKAKQQRINMTETSAGGDKSGSKQKKSDPKGAARRATRRMTTAISQQQQQMEDGTPTVGKEADIGSYVQVFDFPPTALELEMERIKEIQATSEQDICINAIKKIKFQFDAELKLLRHKKIKLDYYIKTAENTMVLLTEEFMQATKCEDVEASLESLITNTNRETRTCQATLKNVMKQIENRKKEMEDIAVIRSGLLKEVIEIASKVPSYEHYLVRVFRKRMPAPKAHSQRDDDDDDDDEDEDSDDSDDMNFDDADDDDDDLDVDFPPPDLSTDIYDAVVEVRNRRLGVDDTENSVRASIDELTHQANTLRSRIVTADRTLVKTQAELDAFIFDKQNKLNSMHYAVSLNIHQILHMAKNLDKALVTSKSTIQRLRERIPELRKEKKLQRRAMADTRREFYRLQNSKLRYQDKLQDKSDECDHEMLLKFGRLKPIEELELFKQDPDITKLISDLEQQRMTSFLEETKAKKAVERTMCSFWKEKEKTASTKMLTAELMEEMYDMDMRTAHSFATMNQKLPSSDFHIDVARLQALILEQWNTIQGLQMQIAAMTLRANKPLPAIKH